MGITIEVYVYMWINIFVCACVENVEHFERPKFWTAACLRLLKVYIHIQIDIESLYTYACIHLLCTYFNLYYLYSWHKMSVYKSTFLGPLQFGSDLSHLTSFSINPFCAIFPFSRFPFLLLHCHILCASLLVYEYSICERFLNTSISYIQQINVFLLFYSFSFCDLMTLLFMQIPCRQAVGCMQGICTLCTLTHLFVSCTFGRILMQQLQYIVDNTPPGKYV